MTENEHVYAICCRPEVAGDVIPGKNVKTIECYAVLDFEVASFSSSRDIKKIHFVTAAEAVSEVADIDDSIKRKRILVLLNKIWHNGLWVMDSLWPPNKGCHAGEIVSF